MNTAIVQASRCVLSRTLTRQQKHYFASSTEEFVPKTNASRRHIPQSMPLFGIIAAMNKQHIIGINGSLPWDHLPQDKAHFVDMTRDKILIIGRKSFAEEDPSGSHIKHVRACVVLSKTMNDKELMELEEKRKDPKLKLARSFEDALHIVSDLNRCRSGNAELNCDFSAQHCNGIDCWVAGGAGIYKEALQHANLVEVNLTHVDTEIDAESLNQFQKDNTITYFPMNAFRRILFEEVSSKVDGSCTFCVYKRKE